MMIQYESELMKNQKHADVMAPDRTFDVLQSQDGDSLFFSLGTDDVFYLTREVRAGQTGWSRIDLSSGLAAQLKAGSVKARSFCVSQDAANGTIDLLLAVSDGTQDSLCISTGHSNTDLSWADGVNWTHLPFDAAGKSVPKLLVADLSILQNGNGEFFVVDILKDPDNPLGLIERYFINPGDAVKWQAHALPVDLSAGDIVSELGQRAGDMVADTYTFGKIGSTQEMIVTQLYNPWKPFGPANQAGVTARMVVPAGATRMALATGPGGDSTLFLAGNGTLTVFAPDNQNDGAVGVPAVRDPLFSGVQALRAATTRGRTAVWVINQQGTLFSTSCPAGSEGTPGAWSTPLPILFDVEAMAFFLNDQQDNSVLFAHLQGNQLVQLTQDPGTTEWQQRSILLPSTDPDDMLSYNSFTTHISVVDDFQTPQANLSVSLTAARPVTIYANHVYHVLSPTVPVTLATDATGVLTLVQETQGLSAVTYRLDAGGGVGATIDPMSKLLGVLNGIQNGSDLANVQVKDSDGNQRPLVPAGVTAAQKSAAAETLKQFMQIAATLPANTGPVPPAGPAAVPPGRATPQAAYHLSFTGRKWSPSGTLLAAAPAAASSPPDSPLGDLGSAISVAAGDFFAWVKHAFDDVVGFTIKVVDDVHHFFVKLGETIYHLVLDTVSVVVHAVELVFNKIKVFFEDLIAWLGFLFQWKDIVRTKQVMKNLLKVYAEEAVHRITQAGDELKALVRGLEGKIDAWAGLPADGDTLGTTQQGHSPSPGRNAPQSNWGLHHLSGNMNQMTTSQAQPPSGPWATVKTILDDLERLIAEEGDAFMTAFKQLKTDVMEAHTSLTVGELVKRITAILLDLLLTSAGNILATGLDIIAALVGGIVDLLDAPIKIPVISAVYRAVAGDDLSILDLMCLVTAIPVTIVYKMLKNEAPFPDDAHTGSLKQAPDLATFKAALHGRGPQMRQAALQTAAAGPGHYRQPAQEQQADTTLVKGEPFDILTLSLYLAGEYASAAMIAINGAKAIIDPAPCPWWLSLLGFAAYLPYVAPNIPGALGDDDTAWYTILNDGVTLISICKVGLDALPDAEDSPWPKKISPWIETAINTVWLVPACAAIAAGPQVVSNRLGFVANAFFDLSGCITPATVFEQWKADPVTAKAGSAAFTVLSLFGTMLYGIFCGAYAVRYTLENP